MITKNHIVTTLLIIGLLSFWAASQFYAWRWISGLGYDKFYSIGLLIWSIRHRMLSVSQFDILVANIAFWLCVFNVYDDFFAKNPLKPYKPYILTTIVILSCIYTYYLKCRRSKKDLKT